MAKRTWVTASNAEEARVIELKKLSGNTHITAIKATEAYFCVHTKSYDECEDKTSYSSFNVPRPFSVATFKADYIGEDDFSRDIYKHTNGTKYVMIDSSATRKESLHTLTSHGEPDYPIRMHGVYVTLDMIEGKAKC